MLCREREEELDVLNDSPFRRGRWQAVDNLPVLDQRIEPRLDLVLILVVTLGHVVRVELRLRWWWRRRRGFEALEDGDAEREDLVTERGNVRNRALNGVDGGVSRELVWRQRTQSVESVFGSKGNRGAPGCVVNERRTSRAACRTGGRITARSRRAVNPSLTLFQEFRQRGKQNKNAWSTHCSGFVHISPKRLISSFGIVGRSTTNWTKDWSLFDEW